VPLFMDVHTSLPDGATADDVARAHAADVEIRDRYVLVEAPRRGLGEHRAS
jgi:hypothetical protein